MRIWIMISGLTIAYSINPDVILPISLCGVIIFLMVAGTLMDIIDFTKNIKKG